MISPSRLWTRLPAAWLPFADAATAELPLARLARLGLFQVSVGITTALLAGTLNRVMIVELGVPTSLVALMLALPLLAAPFRALVGFRSDVHRSVLGWRRVPFLWAGTMLQFGGLAIMPFALILLSGDTNGSMATARAAAALAFLLVGAGVHTVQTAGLALATDLAPAHARPRAVALLQLLLLVGLLAGSAAYGLLLADFSQLRLIQVVQGSAVVAFVLNVVALWQQEPRHAHAPPAQEPRFREAWAALTAAPGARRLLVAVALGTAAFGMQDVLLEPYGGEILRLGVGATAALTGIAAAGALAAFALAARQLARGTDAPRLAAAGATAGIVGFAAVIFAAPLFSPALFRAGAAIVGFGAGLFTVGTLAAAMSLEGAERRGLALGAWGAVQATAAGVAFAAGGLLRDAAGALALRGALGAALQDASVGYSVVYHLETLLLFATLVALGPLVAPAGRAASRAPGRRIPLADPAG